MEETASPQNCVHLSAVAALLLELNQCTLKRLPLLSMLCLLGLLCFKLSTCRSHSCSCIRPWAALPSLNSITLSGSNITGTVPESWKNMTQLRMMTVSNSQLTGPLPASWAALPSLNYIPSNNLNGSLPVEWSNMTQLSLVELRDNRLSGSLPEAWVGMSQLRYVALVNNTLISNMKLPQSHVLGCCPLQEHIMAQMPCCYHQFVQVECSPLHEGLHVHSYAKERAAHTYA